MSSQGGLLLAVGAGVTAAVWLGTRERKVAIAKLATDTDDAVTYLHAYAAQRVMLARDFGTIPGTDGVPVTPASAIFNDIWPYWVAEVNRRTGLDTGAGTGILGDANRAATVTTPGRIMPGVTFLKGDITGATARALVVAYNTFQVDVQVPPLSFDAQNNLTPASAVRFWAELAKLAVFFNTANLVPETNHFSAAWASLARGAKNIPPALAGFFGSALAAMADASAGALAAFALALLSSPVVWVILAVAGWYFRAELRDLVS